MIPADVASSLRLVQPDLQSLANKQTQPVATAQRIADVLSDATPGQRILAEIQALLPNGTYRALVAQRDVTLALPFSAKPGDTLELEVTESDGKLTLAFVTNRTDGSMAKLPSESVATSLSSTGQLIGNLMGEIESEGKNAPATPLNGSQPLVEAMPKSAADLAPVLKQALSESGMFYEAHQARWVAGDLSTDALKQEPQGKLSTTQSDATVNPKNNPNLEFSEASNNQHSSLSARTEATINNPVPRDLIPIVQQQLDGLANQNFAWQGQIWPGQQMRWEIGENPEDARSAGSDEIQHWQTRLKLSLPALGNIDVTLNLKVGGEVRLSVTSDSEASELRLRDEAMQLRKQLEAAGLKLTELSLQHDAPSE